MIYISPEPRLQGWQAAQVYRCPDSPCTEPVGLRQSYGQVQKMTGISKSTLVRAKVVIEECLRLVEVGDIYP